MKKGERLERLIEESVYRNVSQVSKASGVPYTTIKSFIERDLERASIDSVVKIAKLLGVSVEYLVNENNLSSEVNDEKHNLYKFYPAYVSAGLPDIVDGLTEHETISISDKIMGKYANNKDIYFIPVNGESMNKIIPHNSLVAVRPVSTVHDLKNGDIVVYRKDGEYAVKRYIKQPDKVIFRPESNDNSFTDDVVKNENLDSVMIKGKVVLYIVELD